MLHLSNIWACCWGNKPAGSFSLVLSFTYMYLPPSIVTECRVRCTWHLAGEMWMCFTIVLCIINVRYNMGSCESVCVVSTRGLNMALFCSAHPLSCSAMNKIRDQHPVHFCTKPTKLMKLAVCKQSGVFQFCLSFFLPFFLFSVTSIFL